MALPASHQGVGLLGKKPYRALAGGPQGSALWRRAWPQQRGRLWLWSLEGTVGTFKLTASAGASWKAPARSVHPPELVGCILSTGTQIYPTFHMRIHTDSVNSCLAHILVCVAQTQPTGGTAASTPLPSTSKHALAETLTSASVSPYAAVWPLVALCNPCVH